MNVSAEPAQVTVWITNNPYQKIEYIVTVANGKPQSYQRTVYNTEHVEVVSTKSSTNVSAVPQYIRDEVEKQLIPKGVWE